MSHQFDNIYQGSIRDGDYEKANTQFKTMLHTHNYRGCLDHFIKTQAHCGGSLVEVITMLEHSLDIGDCRGILSNSKKLKAFFAQTKLPSGDEE